jgi:Bacteriophage Gp15 protein.
MFDISKRMDDRLVLNGKEYQLFLSFDNVLKVFDMWSDDRFPVQIKPQLALVKLTNSSDFKNMDFETALNIYSKVFDKHIKSVRAIDAVERYDLEGNVIPKNHEKTQTTENLCIQSNMTASSFFHRLCKPITLI